MSNKIRWFVAGVFIAAVFFGAVVAGISLSSDDADAQGTWQVWSANRPARTHEEMQTPLPRPNPDWFLADWVATLPDSCDIVLTEDVDTAFYRCP